jgi:hypothetical protein
MLFLVGLKMLKFRKLKNATHHLELGEMGFLAVERVKRMWVSPHPSRHKEGPQIFKGTVAPD